MRAIKVEDLIEEAQGLEREEVEMEMREIHDKGQWSVWEMGTDIIKPRVVMTGSESECRNYCSDAPLEYEGVTYHRYAALPIITIGEVPEWK